MFSPSSGLYSCPLAMTDGAAKTIEVVSLTLFLSAATAYLQCYFYYKWVLLCRSSDMLNFIKEDILIPNTCPAEYFHESMHLVLLSSPLCLVIFMFLYIQSVGLRFNKES